MPSEARHLGLPMREHRYFVYIMTNCSRHPLYTGVTRSVDRRTAQHKSGFDGPTSYTARYQIDRLVYFEEFQHVRDAICREKQIKSWGRAKKIALVESVNPKWDDLSGDWQQTTQYQDPSLRSG
jgi:putative endonuclease